jgi:hypothetical protein
VADGPDVKKVESAPSDKPPLVTVGPSLSRQESELEQYRSLMTPPSTFEDGFSWISLAGAAFVALLMVPGAMYMGLLVGAGIGPAAQWVTVILFIEIAKRAHKALGKAEIFVFFYIAGGLLANPFGGLLGSQFLVQSEAVSNAGLTDLIPSWFAPHDPAVLRQRSFFMREWLPVIGMIVFQNIIGRLNGTILCYGLFRVASDIEKLPFPMAPLGAQGILALAEDADESAETSKRWRWRTFSIGASLGMAFAVIYVALPSLSQAYFGETLTIFPIPFADFTTKTQDFLPATATGLTFDFGNLIAGMVVPFFAVVGSSIGMVVTFIMNPLLHKHGYLYSWQSGDDLIMTSFKNYIDFYLSFGIGISIGIAIIGAYSIWKSLAKSRANKQMGATEDKTYIKQRGHIPLWIVLGVYFFTTMAYILLSGYLVDWHRGVMIVLLVIGFVYTPVVSYVTARLEGMVGQAIDIPMVKEAGYILSGYKGSINIWFIPIPLHNYGLGTVFYRQSELVGSRFHSIWKSDVITFPIVLVSSILFASMIWSLAPVPSAAYPYAAKMWELDAKKQCVWYGSTMGEFSQFSQALKPTLIGIGTVASVTVYSILNYFGASVFLMYGMVQGLNQTLPHVVIPQLFGALLGRFYFQKRFGEKWLQYAPVLGAGYFCGAGLVSVLSIGLVFLSKAVLQTPF